MSAFEFGEQYVNPDASDDNPRKVGYFVKNFFDHRRGWVFEFTDKRGDFWQFSDDRFKTHAQEN